MSDQRMIAAQADIISRQNRDIESFQKTIERYEIDYDTNKANACFWLAMQKAIKENFALQSAWGDFIAILRMTAPDPGPDRAAHWNDLFPHQKS